MKIKVYAGTNRVGSRVETTIEIPDEDLEGLDENERNRFIDEWAQEVMWQLVEWGWEECKSRPQ